MGETVLCLASHRKTLTLKVIAVTCSSGADTKALMVIWTTRRESIEVKVEKNPVYGHSGILASG